jgi:hypothetical protein
MKTNVQDSSNATTLGGVDTQELQELEQMLGADGDQDQQDGIGDPNDDGGDPDDDEAQVDDSDGDEGDDSGLPDGDPDGDDQDGEIEELLSGEEGNQADTNTAGDADLEDC